LHPQELNQMHTSIPYAIKINSFLEAVQPFFTDKNGKKFYIKKFTSLQIHAGDYFIRIRKFILC